MRRITDSWGYRNEMAVAQDDLHLGTALNIVMNSCDCRARDRKTLLSPERLRWLILRFGD